MRAAKILCILILVLVLAGGLTDLDWMVVCYRYSEWHRSQDFWEFCPYLKLNWWLAYYLTVLRVVVSAFLLGVLLGKTLQR